MEAATADRIAEVEAEAPVEPAAPQATAGKMFKYSQFVDVGEGAAECADSRTGECKNIEHFHAWCRLPNPYQHEDIRKRSLAAKARMIRTYRDPESDESVVLDQQLSLIDDETFVEMLVDELLAADWATDYIDSQSEVETREEFEHIAHDREELARLKAIEGEGEPSAGLIALEKHMDTYIEALRDELDGRQKPKREEMRNRGVEAIVQLVRQKRVDSESNKRFVDVYDPWMWFIGTYQVDLHKTLGRPHLPKWEAIGNRDRAESGTMYSEAPEVIEALKVVFNELQLALQRASSGN